MKEKINYGRLEIGRGGELFRVIISLSPFPAQQPALLIVKIQISFWFIFIFYKKKI